MEKNEIGEKIKSKCETILIPIKHTFSLKKIDIMTYAEVDQC